MQEEWVCHQPCKNRVSRHDKTCSPPSLMLLTSHLHWAIKLPGHGAVERPWWHDGWSWCQPQHYSLPTVQLHPQRQHYQNDWNEIKQWQVGMGLAFAHSESHSRSEGYLEWGTQGHWKCEVRCGDFNESRGHHPLCNKWGQALVDYILRLHVEREHG